jgi:3-oxoacyl-(acyl-carrier-protein) synthase
MEPRAITGLGIVSTIAIGREAFFRAMIDPKPLSQTASRKLESFDASSFEDPPAFEALAFDAAKFLGDKGLRTLDRLTKLLIVGARLALHDAGLKKDGSFAALTPERTGIVSSNAYGSLEAITELDRVAQLEDARYINPAKFPNTVANSASGYVSIWEELRALNVAVSDGNCGGLDAVAVSDIHFISRRAEAILVGGGEAMSEALFVAFLKLGALARQARLGEGSAFVALEPMASARARGANVMAESIGYGTAFIGPEDGKPLLFASDAAMSRAIEAALADAEVDAKDIDVVASGLAGLRMFDETELLGIQRVLGASTPIAAPKDVLGETLGAGGAMGIAAALAWFQGAPAFPIVAGDAARAKDPRVVLVTSLGYYGNSSAVILRR